MADAEDSSHGAERRISRARSELLDVGLETYWGKHHLYMPSVRSLHGKVRFVVGKLSEGQGCEKTGLGNVDWGYESPGRTLSTLPVILMGWDAPTKSLRRAALTRGDTSSSDIAVVVSDGDECAR